VMACRTVAGAGGIGGDAPVPLFKTKQFHRLVYTRRKSTPAASALGAVEDYLRSLTGVMTWWGFSSFITMASHGIRLWISDRQLVEWC
jgi:hypothetical protein